MVRTHTFAGRRQHFSAEGLAAQTPPAFHRLEPEKRNSKGQSAPIYRAQTLRACLKMGKGAATGAFVCGPRCRGSPRPLRGLPFRSAFPKAKIPSRSTLPTFQTGSLTRPNLPDTHWGHSVPLKPDGNRAMLWINKASPYVECTRIHHDSPAQNRVRSHAATVRPRNRH